MQESAPQLTLWWSWWRTFVPEDKSVIGPLWLMAANDTQRYVIARRFLRNSVAAGYYGRIQRSATKEDQSFANRKYKQPNRSFFSDCTTETDRSFVPFLSKMPATLYPRKLLSCQLSDSFAHVKASTAKSIIMADIRVAFPTTRGGQKGAIHRRAGRTTVILVR